MPNPRPTQKQIAVEAGVHYSVVCRALQNHPSIPERTRERIRAIAEKIGYRPDPMLSALAAYRHTRRSPVFQGGLAWLSASNPTFNWRQVPVYAAYMRGASEQAARRGYTILDYDLNAAGMTPRRLAAILRARNVRGILVCPQPQPHTRIDFPWDDFSAVSLGYTMDSPRLHMVTANHFHSTRLIWEKLTALGYQRIGLAVQGDINERIGGHLLAAYLLDQQALPARRRLLPFVAGTSLTQAAFARWLRQHRPDAIITTFYGFPELLTKLRVKVPDDLGVALVFKSSGKDDFAGIDQNVELTGHVALDYLVAMLHRNERGVPATAQRILVEGRWVDGQTVRPVG